MRDLSRRDLLKRAGAAVAGAGTAAVAGAGAPSAGTTEPAEPAQQAAAGVAREPLEALTPEEADTLEAMVARLVPTDANGPGAREARAAHYIDRALGGFLASSRDAYRTGLANLDAHARATEGARFAQLDAAGQDEILAALERNAVPAFTAASGAAFFNLVLGHTLQGTFGDPYYGGNKNFVGWDLVGYPGVRLAVTPDEQRLDRKPKPLHMSAYDYTMFSSRRPARADAGPAHGGSHGD
jgi:gluconate 2-dehydrogenase gamma chain